MIGAFNALAVAGEMSDVRILGGHSSLAPVTTFGGLTVAIPMLFAYYFIRARINLHDTRQNEEIITPPAAVTSRSASGSPVPGVFPARPRSTSRPTRG